ncbi:MAG: hypothetical protein N0E48_24275, partial [Candidatus Thiodiazotropha endolucinida]|nr:hypothetical protein [Candidatus Thiodiazotropha taylori]MCW4346444.1 hypothetical protein [Candidatus Thiodiazotropha endolucinida]
LAVVDGYRESEASWQEVIEQLESQGLTIPPFRCLSLLGRLITPIVKSQLSHTAPTRTNRACTSLH